MELEGPFDDGRRLVADALAPRAWAHVVEEIETGRPCSVITFTPQKPSTLRPVRDRARKGWPLAGQFWNGRTKLAWHFEPGRYTALIRPRIVCVYAG
jgi:hypothetical protein